MAVALRYHDTLKKPRQLALFAKRAIIVIYKKSTLYELKGWEHHESVGSIIAFIAPQSFGRPPVIVQWYQRGLFAQGLDSDETA